MDYLDHSEFQNALFFKPATYALLKRIQDKKKESQKEEDLMMVDNLHVNGVESENLETKTAPIGNSEMQQNATPHEWTDQQLQQLKSLPNKSYIISPTSLKRHHFALVSLLLASCYNHRTTLGENTVESAWTLVKLSILSTFVLPDSLEDAVIQSARSMLVFPLFRNWALIEKCIKDTAVILKLGRGHVLATLLDVKNVCDMNECAHVLSKVWMEDFCVWIQSTDEMTIKRLGTDLHRFQLEKNKVGFGLVELEERARKM